MKINSPTDVRIAGTKVLVDTLWPVGYARFIQQFEHDYGDYTKEKYEQQEPTFDELDIELKNLLH